MLLWWIVSFFNSRCKVWAEGCCNRLVIFVRPSIHPNPPVLNSRGRLRESTHSRHKGIVVMLSPAQWCSSVQLLPVCVYMAPTSATWLVAILCIAGQLPMQWQYKQAVALKCIIKFRVCRSQKLSVFTVAERDTAAVAQAALGPPESRRWPQNGHPSAAAGRRSLAAPHQNFKIVIQFTNG